MADGRGGDVVLTSQVFVSHTSDMAAFPAGRSFVQAVLDGVGRAGMAAVDMRYFAAREGAPVDYCRRRVRECEIYVAVIGFRYGSQVPGTELSYTEAEFQEATAAGMPRLVFLLDENAPLPEDAADPDRSVVEGFRQRLGRAGLILARFTTPADLELGVYHALSEVAGTLSAAATGPGIRHSLPPDTAGRFHGPEHRVGADHLGGGGRRGRRRGDRDPCHWRHAGRGKDRAGAARGSSAA
jgi:Domain of unknown function (DUF4062)